MKKIIYLITFVISFIVFTSNTYAFTHLCSYEGLDGGTSSISIDMSGTDIYVTPNFGEGNEYNAIYKFTNHDATILRRVDSGDNAFQQIFNNFMQMYIKYSIFDLIIDSETSNAVNKINTTWHSDYNPKENFFDKGLCPNFMYFSNGGNYEMGVGTAIFYNDRMEHVDNHYLRYVRKDPTNKGDKSYFLSDSYLQLGLNGGNTSESPVFKDRISRLVSCDTSKYDTRHINNQVKSDYNDLKALYVSGFLDANGYIEKYYLYKFYSNNDFYKLSDQFFKNYSNGGKCESFGQAHGITTDMIKELRKQYDKFLQQSKYEPLDINLGVVDVRSCSDIIGTGTFAGYLRSSVKFIQYAAPILLIVFSILDYIKALTANDSDVMKKVNKKTIIRLIATLAIFIVPIIINVLLNIFGITKGNCNIF